MIFARSLERGCDNQAENGKGQAVFERVVDLAIPPLDALPRQVNLVEPAEDPVEHADMLAVHVLGGGCLDDVLADCFSILPLDPLETPSPSPIHHAPLPTTRLSIAHFGPVLVLFFRTKKR